jgi:hypothetical protein
MPRRHRVRRSAVAALVPLLLAAATACGGDSDDSSEPSTPSAASGTSSPSAEASDSASPTAAAGKRVDPDEFVEMFRTSFEQATTAHLTMTMKGTGLSMTAEGDVDYSTEPPAVAMTLNGDQFGKGTDVRLVDGVMYLKTSMLGNKFVKMDLADPANPLGERFGRAFDLRSVLDGFRSGLQSVTLLGQEDMDGERLRHYQVVMDPAAAAAANKADPSASATAGMPETVTYDLWFDGEGFFRRMEADLGPEGGAVTAVLSDWGRNVDIEAPPASQVTGTPGGA